MRKLAPLLVTVLALSSCGFGASTQTPANDMIAFSSSSIVQQEFTGEGIIQRIAVGTYPVGTHALLRDDGSLVALLLSSSVRLDDYVDNQVRVTGLAEPSSEPGVSLVTVAVVEAVSASSSLESSSASSESSSMQSSAEVATSSSVSSSSSLVSSAPVVSSKSSSSVVVSSKTVVSSSVSSSTPVVQVSSSSVDPKLAAMQRSTVGSELFVSQYCTVNGGFCIPMHKKWYFTSFQRQAGTLWHVEIGPQEINALGEGLIVVDLIKGPLPADSADQTAVVSGNDVLVYKAWKENHLVVKAPVTLQSQAEYIAKNVTEPVASSSSSSVSSAASSSSAQ
jgi:hypothetical protein